MRMKRAGHNPRRSREASSLFSSALILSTSLTPASFIFSTPARADEVHAVCVKPDDTVPVANPDDPNGPPIDTPQDYSTLAALGVGDKAYIQQFSSSFFPGAAPGFEKVANPGGVPTFKLTGDLNFVTRAGSNPTSDPVLSVVPASLGDLTHTDNTLTYARVGPGEIVIGDPFPSTGSGDAGAAGIQISGAIGLPILSTVEATNTEVQDLIRQRRQLAAASVTTVAAVAVPTESSSSPSSPPATKPSSGSSAKSQGASPGEAGTVIDYDSSPSQAIWAQAFADYERHDGLAPGSGENLVRKQTTVGGISGADTTYRRHTADGLETFQFGLMGGGTHVSSKFSDFGDISNARQTQDGGFVGAYGTYRLNNISFDGFFKADLLKLRQRSTVTGPVKCGDNEVLVIDDTPNALVSSEQVGGSVNEYTYTVGGNAYYRFDLNNGAFFEPVAGFIFSATNYGDGATALGLDNGQLFRLQGGARLGRSWDDAQNRTWSVAILGLLYSDVYVNGYTLGGFGLPPGASEVDQGKLRILGQLEGNVDLNNGLSLNGTVNVRGGENVVGVGGRLGARLAW